MRSARARSLAAMTCIHCGEPIEDQEVVVRFEDGQCIHVRCWRPSSPSRLRASSTPTETPRKLD
jgi:predicted RNA-binding Zn-ribbon protein involved in translation (DUF1610 family)